MQSIHARGWGRTALTTIRKGIFSNSSQITVVLTLTVTAPSPAWAQNPFSIDGTIPDNGVVAINDPFGSVQELGPVNGNDTKIGVIHNDTPPMLGFTNPNGQTDLRRIWLATRQAIDGDVWLYYAWERDSSSGSSVITYEFQHATYPAGCDYSGEIDWLEPVSAAEANLIANCNPWSARQNGDFLIVWDFKGGATNIILREFDGMAFGVEDLADEFSPARLNSDNSRGEGAINLTEYIFSDSECDSFGSVLTGTVTGNSDSADYKDTVISALSGELSISNCGTVIVRKLTEGEDPSGVDSFAFTFDLEFLPASTDTGFNLSSGYSMSYTNVVTPGEDYSVQETSPGPNYRLTAIDCSTDNNTANVKDTDLATGTVTFDLDRAETLDCTFINTRQAQITLVKNTVGDSSGTFEFTHEIPGLDSSLTTSNGTASDSSDPLEPGTYSIAEVVPAGWDLDPDNTGCSDGSDPSSIELSAGESVTCTFTNIKRGQITLVKNTVGDVSGTTFDFTHDIPGLDSSLTTSNGTASDTSDPLEPGTYSIEEVGLAGWDLDPDNTSCSDDSDPSSIDLSAGESVTCTFTNVKRGQITLIKNTESGDATFGFTHAIPGLDSSLTTVGGTATDTSGLLLPGNYSISEDPLDGWALDADLTSCSDGSDPSSIGLSAGESVTCTFTNKLQLGAIRIFKTRKFAAAFVPEVNEDVTDEPHPQVAFEISGGELESPVSVTTELVTIEGVEYASACVDNLPFSSVAGDYTVTEIVPAGYVADGDGTVTPGDPEAEPPVAYAVNAVAVDQVGDCENGGERIVNFSNTPLTDVTVSAVAQDEGATRSRINCYQATMEEGSITLGALIGEEATGFANPASVMLADQLPGYPDSLIVCTVEIDP